MTTTKSANGQNGYPLAMLIRNSAHDIWLAGLGAYARAGKEGSRLFESLVDLGGAVERRAREEVSRPIRAAERSVDGARSAVAEAWEQIELLIERRITRTLHALQIPTQQDIAELTERVEQLTKTVRKLTRERDAAARKAARPAAARKKPARRKARPAAKRRTAAAKAGSGRTPTTRTRS
jgi:poly(hydroxyalkanoate) granule-associated protein